MTTETKLGLLLGMGVIILVGIFISDHLSKANSQQATDLAESVGPLDESQLPPGLAQDPRDRDGGQMADASDPEDPLPLPDDFESEPEPEPEPEPVEADRRQASANGGDERQPRLIHVDVPPAQILRGRDGEEVIDGEQPMDDEPAVATADVPDEFEVVEEPEVRPFDPEELQSEREHRRAQERAERERQAAEREAAEAQAAEAESDDSGPVVHYVQENETLSAIAEEYYGEAGYYEMIYEANREAISNPNFVRPGVRLVIPDAAGSVARRQSGDSSGAADGSGSVSTQTYTVGENDTIWSIAQRFYGSGAKSEELIKLNEGRLDNPDRLAVGDELLVPVR